MGKDLKGKELGKGLSQRKDGRYCGRYTDRFGVRKTFYHDRLAEARRMLNQAVYENENKINFYNDTMTLNDWFEMWIDLYKKNTVRATSLNAYKTRYNTHIKNEIGSLRIKDITVIHVQKLINKMAEEGYKYQMLSLTKTLLIDLFDKATLAELIKNNPAKNITLKKKDEKPRRVLTAREQELFLKYAEGKWYENLLVFALSTGLRIGELGALTWDDIDFEKKTASVNKTLIYARHVKESAVTYEINPPKTQNSERSVPLTRKAIIALKKQKIQCQWAISKAEKKSNTYPLEGFENLVFMTRIASPVRQDTIQTSINTIIKQINNKKEGVPEFVPFSPHTLRHSFATRAFERGMKPRTVQEILGHVSLSMTMDLYTHVTDDMLSKEMECMEDTVSAPNGVKLSEITQMA